VLNSPDGAIVPVRAIFYVTAGAITPLGVATAIADTRVEADAWSFGTPLRPGYIGAAGELNPMSCAELQKYADAVTLLWKADASELRQIAAMPGGVYLTLAQVQSLVDEVNAICGGPGGDGLEPTVILPKPRMSPVERALVLEGFEALMSPPRIAGSKVSARKRRGGLTEENRTEDRAAVISIARTHWAEQNRVSLRAALKLPAMERYIVDWSKGQVMEWIREADERKAVAKPGRRWPPKVKK